jgi:uracil-DNA glycosylase
MSVTYWKNLPEGKLSTDHGGKAGSGVRREDVHARAGAALHIDPADIPTEPAAPASLDECRRCELWKNATHGVPGEGPAHAGLMVVGEQPGDQEDLAGLPFVGPAGKLLDHALEKAGIERKSVYVTNAVKHFKWEPRGKRRIHKTPAQREIAACAYWLDHEVENVQPQVIVALGATALKAVLHTGKVTLGAMLGKPVQQDGRWVVATYHPSYVLRIPDEDAKAAAFKEIVRALHLAAGLLQH